MSLETSALVSSVMKVPAGSRKQTADLKDVNE